MELSVTYPTKILKRARSGRVKVEMGMGKGVMSNLNEPRRVKACLNPTHFDHFLKSSYNNILFYFIARWVDLCI